MNISFLSFVKQGLWYALANVLIKVSGLILLPIYTNTTYLSIDEYGLWGIFEVTTQIAITLFSFQLATGVVRFYLNPEQNKNLMPTAWWFTVISTIVIAMLFSLVVYLTVPTEFKYISYLLIIFVSFEILITIPLAQLRAQERAKYYSAILIFKLFLIIILNIILLTQYQLGLEGIVLSYVIASGITLGFSLVFILRSITNMRIRWQSIITLLYFSLPLVLGGLGSMVLNLSGRYVIVFFHSTEEVALFTLASKFGSIINMLFVQPLNLALLPILISLEKVQREEFLQNTVYYICIIIAFAVIIISIFTEPLLRIIQTDEIYYSAINFVPFIAGGYAFFGISRIFSSTLVLFKKTKIVSVWLITVAIFYIILSILLVPFIGPIGAAISLLVSYFLLCVGQYTAVKKIEFINYPWKQIFIILSLTIAIIIVNFLVSINILYIDILTRITMVVVWVAGLFLFRCISIKEFQHLRRLLQSKE